MNRKRYLLVLVFLVCIGLVVGTGQIMLESPNIVSTETQAQQTGTLQQSLASQPNTLASIDEGNINDDQTLRVLRFDIADNTIPTNNYVKAEVIVSNYGSSSASFELSPYLAEKSSDKLDVKPQESYDVTLDSGEQQRYTFKLKFSEIGDYTVRVDGQSPTVATPTAEKTITVQDSGSAVIESNIINRGELERENRSINRFKDGDLESQETGETQRIPPVDNTENGIIVDVAEGNLFDFSNMRGTNIRTKATINETTDGDIRVGLYAERLSSTEHYAITTRYKLNKSLKGAEIALVKGNGEEIDTSTKYMLGADNHEVTKRVFQLSQNESEYIQRNNELFLVVRNPQTSGNEEYYQKIRFHTFEIQSLSRIISRAESNLQVTRLQTDVSSVNKNQSFRVQGTIRNIGTESITRTYNLLESNKNTDKTTVRTTDEITLNPGESLDVSFKMSRDVTGTHRFYLLGESTSVDVFSSQNLPPSPVIDISTDIPRIGEPVQFDASQSSDPDGDIVSYKWDVDDDGTFEKSGQTIQEDYNNPGFKYVTLRLTDDNGRKSSARTRVKVRIKPDAGGIGYHYDAATEPQEQVENILPIQDTNLVLESSTCDSPGYCGSDIEYQGTDLWTGRGLNLLVLDEQATPVFYGAYDVYEGSDYIETTSFNSNYEPLPTDKFTQSYYSNTDRCSDGDGCATTSLIDAINQYNDNEDYYIILVGDDEPRPTHEHDTELFQKLRSMGAEMDKDTGQIGYRSSWIFVKRAQQSVLREQYAPRGGESEVPKVRTNQRFVTVNVTNGAGSDAPKDTTITFDASKTVDKDNDVQNLTYEWDFDLDGDYEKRGIRATWDKYTTDGTHTARLRVTDPDTLSDTTEVTIVMGNDQPKSISPDDQTVVAGDPLQVDGTESIDPDGKITRFEWDFDDDGVYEVSDSRRPTYVYENEGRYTVSLRVTGSEGQTDTSSFSVQVKNRPPNPQVDTWRYTVDFDGTDGTSARELRDEFWPKIDDGLMYRGTNGGLEWAEYDEPHTSKLVAPVPSNSESVKVNYDFVGESYEDSGFNIYMYNSLTTQILDCNPDLTTKPYCPRPEDQEEVTRLANDGEASNFVYDKNRYISSDSWSQVRFTTNMLNVEGKWYDRAHLNSFEVISNSSNTAYPRVQLNASRSTDLNGFVEKYEWDIDNDGTFERTGETTTIKYDDISTYEVRVRVTDDQGATNTKDILVKVDDIEPSAVITAPSTVPAGKELELSATDSSDPSNNIQDYKWFLGDDVTRKRGSSVTHTYEESGTYEVTLVVRDTNGLVDSVTKTITVENDKPNADLSTPSSTFVGNPITLDASATIDPNGDALRYNWDVPRSTRTKVQDGMVYQAGFESDGVSVFDQARANKGTIENSDGNERVPGVRGKQALQLQRGTQDYVRVPDSNSLDVDSTATTSTWVYMDSASQDQVFVAKDNQMMLWYDASKGGMRYEVRTDSEWKGVVDADGITPANLNADTWYHVTGVINGSTVQLYVDGNQVGQGELSQAPTVQDTFNPVTLGYSINYGSQNRQLDGRLDDTRIYDRALTADEVKTTANHIPRLITSELVARYAFDTGTRSTVYDTGRDFTATINGDGNNARTSSPNGNALGVDGEDYLVANGDVIDGDARDSVTISAWVYPDTYGSSTRDIIFNQENELEMALNDGNLEYAYRENGQRWRWIDSGADLPTGQWNHVAITYNASQTAVYVNGNQVDSSPADKSKLDDYNKDFHVGWRSSKSEERFHGDIDDVRVHETALTTAQVSILADRSRLESDRKLDNGEKYRWTPESVGEYTPTVTATDSEDASDSASSKITIYNTQPKSIFSYSSPDGNPSTGETITFDGRESYDPDGHEITYKWDFQNDGTFDAVGPVVKHTYSGSQSEETVRLVVEDTYRKATESTQTINLNEKPIADISKDQTINSERQVHAPSRSKQCSDPDNCDVTIETKTGGKLLVIAKTTFDSGNNQDASLLVDVNGKNIIEAREGDSEANRGTYNTPSSPMGVSLVEVGSGTHTIDVYENHEGGEPPWISSSVTVVKVSDFAKNAQLVSCNDPDSCSKTIQSDGGKFAFFAHTSVRQDKNADVTLNLRADGRTIATGRDGSSDVNTYDNIYLTGLERLGPGEHTISLSESHESGIITWRESQLVAVELKKSTVAREFKCNAPSGCEGMVSSGGAPGLITGYAYGTSGNNDPWSIRLIEDEEPITTSWEGSSDSATWDSQGFVAGTNEQSHRIRLGYQSDNGVNFGGSRVVSFRFQGGAETAKTFDASSSYDPDGGSVEYDWDTDNDGAYEVSQPIIGLDDISSTELTVRVTDDEGSTDTAIYTVSSSLGTSSNPATSCTEIQRKRVSPPSGEYYISPDGYGSSYTAYCELAEDSTYWETATDWEPLIENTHDNENDDITTFDERAFGQVFQELAEFENRNDGIIRASEAGQYEGNCNTSQHYDDVELSGDSNNGCDRMKYEATVPENTGKVRVNFKAYLYSYEYSGFTVYAIDENGNTHTLVCEPQSPVPDDGASCSRPDVSGSTGIDGRFTIDTGGPEVEKVVLANYAADCCFDRGDHFELERLNVEVERKQEAYTFKYMPDSTAQITDNVKDSNSCTERGLMMFVPRSPSEYDAGRDYVANGYGYDPSNWQRDVGGLGPMGLYDDDTRPGDETSFYRGENINGMYEEDRDVHSTQYGSDSLGYAGWENTAGQTWWIANNVANNEPNGDHNVGGWMGWRYDNNGNVYGYNDLDDANTVSGGGYDYREYLCVHPDYLGE